MKNLGFLLLCGGHSSRMGQDKALLDAGGEALYRRAARAGAAFSERIFSANGRLEPPEGFIPVRDSFADCGPMAGIHAGLLASRSEALVCAPCDAPYYDGELAAFLAESWHDGLDALILRDGTGRVHPLMGVYAKTCLPAFEDCLKAGKLKIMLTLNTLRLEIIGLDGKMNERVFLNLNTPESYEAFLRAERENTARGKADF